MAARGSFSRAVVGSALCGVPVGPGTVAKLVAAHNRSDCGWASGQLDPALVPEATIGLIKKDSTNKAYAKV